MTVLTYSYNMEVKYITAQVLDVFNDTIIYRMNDKTGVIDPEKKILVPCVYAARSRRLKEADSPEKQLRIPIMSLSNTGIARDTSRVHSVKHALHYSTSGKDFDFSKNIGIPIDITFDLNILTKSEDDIDQIISNIVVRFNPDIYIIWPFPRDPTYLLKSQLIWSGSISQIMPEEITKDQRFDFQASTQFTCKTWLFPGSGSWGPGTAIGDYTNVTDETISKGLIKHINLPDGFSDKVHFYSGYNPKKQNGIWGMNAWYAVPNLQSFDEFTELIKNGNVPKYFFDQLPILNSIEHAYWVIPSVVIDGSIYNPLYKRQLDYILSVDQENWEIVLISTSGEMLRPEAQKYTDKTLWKDIFTRMQSGDLQNCVSEQGQSFIKETFLTDHTQQIVGFIDDRQIILA